MNGSNALDASKGMTVKFADAKIMPDMGHSVSKRNFGMEGFAAPGNKRAFTGGMPGMPGFSPYGMPGMGYDMSQMMGMGYNGMMAGMPGMHGMVRGAQLESSMLGCVYVCIWAWHMPVHMNGSSLPAVPPLRRTYKCKHTVIWCHPEWQIQPRH